MQSKLKICGITTIDDARRCVDLGVDWLGFNFYPDSPRYVEPEIAGRIISAVAKEVHCVGIFVKPELNDLKKNLEQTGIHRFQIYDPQGFNDLSVLTKPSIICYRLNELAENTINFLGADMVLLDSFSKKVFGGTGRTFDWDQIPEHIPRERLALAGGINPENIQQALEQVNPAVIDVASGGEISPGKKDFEKIKSMVDQLKRFNEKN